jgi:hypothetical protein
MVGRNERDPKLVAQYLADAEAKLAARIHPDPYICAYYTRTLIIYVLNFLFVAAKFPGGTGW